MEQELEIYRHERADDSGSAPFWLQFVGVKGLVRWVVMAALLIVVCALSRQVWLYGLAAVALVFTPAVWVFGYFSFLRRSFQRYGRMESKVVTYRFTEAGLGSQSDLGTAEIPWRMLDQVQCYPDVWLLFMGRRDYAYLPVSEMPDGLAAYILQQAEKHQIKTR